MPYYEIIRHGYFEGQPPEQRILLCTKDPLVDSKTTGPFAEVIIHNHREIPISVTQIPNILCRQHKFEVVREITKEELLQKFLELWQKFFVAWMQQSAAFQNFFFNPFAEE